MTRIPARMPLPADYPGATMSNNSQPPDQPEATTTPAGTKTDAGGHVLSSAEQFFLEHVFKYHPPGLEDIPKYQAIRAAARHLAETIIVNAPVSADRTVALRRVREAVMSANAAIATKGQF